MGTARVFSLLIVACVVLLQGSRVAEAQAAFCAVRPGQSCCPGRDDECTMPILDTVCYCDMFCNRTDVHDCCPDYWDLCLGIAPPPGARTFPPTIPTTTERPPPAFTSSCEHGGRFFSLGMKIRDNCNDCVCSRDPYGQGDKWVCNQKKCVIREKIIDGVNQGNYGWRASNYSFLWGMPLQDGVKYRLGTYEPYDDVAGMSTIRVNLKDDLPPSFDARIKWAGLITPVRDQGNCGSSWAFSSVGVASDRLALHSKGAIKDTLSPQQLISCNARKQGGCEGGHLDRAWWYLRKVGVVSEKCYPYNSGSLDSSEDCLIPRSTIPRNVVCPGNTISSSRIYQATPPYKIRGERAIMKEIMTNGPVQATFEVKEDFYMYRGGVYRHTPIPKQINSSNQETGYHSVRIVGWGEDVSSTGERLRYWLCANSWGTGWGEEGYFRVLRGVNECDVESFVIGIWGKVGGRQIISRRSRSRRRRHLRHHRRNRDKKHNKNKKHNKKNKGKKNKDSKDSSNKKPKASEIKTIQS